MSGTTQGRFARSLLKSEPDMEGLAAWSDPRRRLGVHRNNRSAGLTRSLAVRFPAAEKVVGTEFFAGMAHAFIDAQPPRSPLLLDYGDDLADFAGTFEPAAGLPYLADLIRLENARVHAFHAADGEPLEPAALGIIAGERLAGTRFVIHPATAVVRSSHPVLTIWAMNVGEIPLTPIENWVGENALVTRPTLTVLIHKLPPGGAAFVEALAGAKPLAEAAECGFAEAAVFDLAASLAAILRAGAFRAVV